MFIQRTNRSLLLLTSFVLLSMLGLLLMGANKASKNNHPHTCTLATIKGTYVFEANGIIIEEEEIRPYAEAGTWTLDGNGNAVGTVSASIAGVPFARSQEFTATYSLESGCIYSAADGFGLDFDLYTEPEGDTITYFSPGFSGTMFKH